MGCCSSGSAINTNNPGRPNTNIEDENTDDDSKRRRFAHDILALQQPTVSELHSYSVPPNPLIMDVMVATFLLLGEPKDNLEFWQDIQALLRRVGPTSLMFRVKKFSEKQAKDVEESTVLEVQEMIRAHDLDTVRICSPAAGTFYVWVNDNVTEIIKNGNLGNMGR